MTDLDELFEESRRERTSKLERILALVDGARVRWFASSRDRDQKENMGDIVRRQWLDIGESIALNLEDFVAVLEQAVKNCGASPHPGMVNDTMTRGLAVQTYSALRKLARQHPIIPVPGGPINSDDDKLTNDELAAIEKLIHRLGEHKPIPGDDSPAARRARGQDPIRPAKKRTR